MYNAGNRKDVRDAEKSARASERSREDVIRSLCSTSPGREYIWSLLSEAHLFHTSYALDPTQTAFNEGERNFGLRILDDVMRACPEQFTVMMREANGRRTAAAAEPDNNRVSDDYAATATDE